jgi:hypothetical protein
MRTLLRWSTFVTAFMLGAIAVGLTWGLIGVAATYAAGRWLLVLPDTWISTRGAAIKLSTALVAACAALPFAAAATGAALLLRLGLVEAGVPAVVRLIIVAPSVVAIYAALIWALSPALRDQGVDALRLARGRGREA